MTDNGYAFVECRDWGHGWRLPSKLLKNGATSRAVRQRIEEYQLADWARVNKLNPEDVEGADTGHSGNTWGLAQSLAYYLITDPPMVVLEHGAEKRPGRAMVDEVIHEAIMQVRGHLIGMQPRTVLGLDVRRRQIRMHHCSGLIGGRIGGRIGHVPSHRTLSTRTRPPG